MKKVISICIATCISLGIPGLSVKAANLEEENKSILEHIGIEELKIDDIEIDLDDKNLSVETEVIRETQLNSRASVSKVESRVAKLKYQGTKDASGLGLKYNLTIEVPYECYVEGSYRSIYSIKNSRINSYFSSTINYKSYQQTDAWSEIASTKKSAKIKGYGVVTTVLNSQRKVSFQVTLTV